MFVEAEAAQGDALHRLVRDVLCVPPSAVRITPLSELPRLASGKVDRPALVALARRPGVASAPHPVTDATAAVRELYASSLGRDSIIDADSFSSLGGDSLSYVEVSLGLEEALGRLPEAWETMSVGALGALGAAAARPPGSWWASLLHARSIETGVALRALAIVLVVATHIGMIAAPGGAHVLMAVAGYNFARFRLTAAERSGRVRSILRATARVALPAMAWVAAVMLLTGEYELRHLLLMNALVRDELWGNLWFVELLVYISLAMAAVLAVPAVDRAERRWPFAVALGVVGVGLLFRFGLVDFGVPYTMPVLWLFAIGWAASRADRAWQRGSVLGDRPASIPGYFESIERNAVIARRCCCSSSASLGSASRPSSARGAWCSRRIARHLPRSLGGLAALRGLVRRAVAGRVPGGGHRPVARRVPGTGAGGRLGGRGAADGTVPAVHGGRAPWAARTWAVDRQ